MYPEGKVDAANALENISINNKKKTVSTLLKNIATVRVSASPPEINHADLQPVVNVYASADGRDVGSVSAEIETKLEALRQSLPPGYALRVSGEYQSLKEAFGGLAFGLVLAVIMVYLVIVPLLRSFKLPLIILLTVPLGLTGVVFALFVTNTTLNIQSFLGVIMMVGITVAYTNLLVDKINALRTQERMPLHEAITVGAASRLRPVLMTAITAVMSLLPMAIGLERGGEANVPLGRAIIGGTLAAAFLTMFVAPCLFYVFSSREEQATDHHNSDGTTSSTHLSPETNT
jgi:multidrug efflux pump subunit AcrB